MILDYYGLNTGNPNNSIFTLRLTIIYFIFNLNEK